MLRADFNRIVIPITVIAACMLLIEYVVRKLPDWAPDWCWEHRHSFSQWADFYPFPGTLFNAVAVIMTILLWLLSSLTI